MLLHSNILGEGHPFIILHGFLGMSDNWKTLGKKFSEKGYQVHLIDQRNHGRSFHSKDFNYELLANDLKYYISHNQLKNCILLGHSMGGKTAMQFATQHSKIIKNLIIADIAPRYYPTHHDAILEGLSALNFSEIKSRREADALLRDHIDDIGTRQFLLKNLYWVEKGQLGLRINLEILKEQVAEVGEALPNFAKYEGNTLFLRGDKSEYIAPSDEHLIKTHFPHAEILTIDNAGHWLHAENPKDFFEAVIHFLKHTD